MAGDVCSLPAKTMGVPHLSGSAGGGGWRRIRYAGSNCEDPPGNHFRAYMVDVVIAQGSGREIISTPARSKPEFILMGALAASSWQRWD
jgi:hypothetical protein